jgi:nucleoside-diphosphate kinase
MDHTFSIIKPDAVRRNLIGHINQIIEKAGLKIIASKKMYLTKQQAETFYFVHKERPFFNSLVDFMTSGPVQVQVLEGSEAVSSYRKIMGATNPDDAEEGTIRKLYAESIEANSVHGSDSVENANIEINFFFSGSELV